MALERGSTGAEETGANAGTRERSGGGCFVPLSLLVFLGAGQDTEGGATERHDGEGNRHVDAMPFPKLVKMTESCGEGEGRELAD